MRTASHLVLLPLAFCAGLVMGNLLIPSCKEPSTNQEVPLAIPESEPGFIKVNPSQLPGISARAEQPPVELRERILELQREVLLLKRENTNLRTSTCESAQLAGLLSQQRPTAESETTRYDTLPTDAVYADAVLADGSGNYAKAAELFEIALRRDPANKKSEHMRYRLGMISLQAGLPGKAIGWFQELATFHPGSELLAESAFYMGCAYRRLNDSDDAIAAFTRAQQMLPTRSFKWIAALYNIGETYLDMGNPGQALIVFTQISTIQTDDEICSDLVNQAKNESERIRQGK